jgi:hypothetical protein
MGKRKISWKKKYPDRHKLILRKREGGGTKAFQNRNGSVTILNHLKHMLFQEPYKKNEYNKDLIRFSNQVFSETQAAKEQ